MINDIHPIILCGGSGTRLWPLSRKSYPKQFVQLAGKQTLFQSCALRMIGPNYAPPTVITNSDFRFIVSEQLNEIGVEAGAVLIEPEGKNTAPAIIASALYLIKENPEAIMLVSPSDHVIPDTLAFSQAIERGLKATSEGEIVTFGIKPSHPETNYGYLQLEEASSVEPVKLSQFIEKPEYAEAKEMVSNNLFLWNAGIFLFKAKDIICAFKKYAVELIENVELAVKNGKTDLGFYRLGAAAWSNVENISIDYAIMEKAENVSVVPFNSEWSDLGGWRAVWHESTQDETGTVTSGRVTTIDCTNSLLRSDNENVELVGIGLDNMIAVAMNDAVLVANMDCAHQVRAAVEQLKIKKVAQATEFPKSHRPWGWFETLSNGNRFQVKRIHVNPGGELSLQSHHHRSEHWIIVSGTGEVTVDKKVQLLSENQSIYIPLGSVHRLRNPGKVPMVLIEVQTGVYLGEDDIIRYDDVYSRK